MDDSGRAFYDHLADHYHLIFANWSASVTRQATLLDRLICDTLGPGPHRILDCACGIGTQAIGLARLGHQVHATDLSPVAVARAEREAITAGVSLSVGVADLRTLATQVPGTFDVVLACDNALPHLLTDDDLRLATANMGAKLRPGGLLLASIRDYDTLVEDCPTGDPPRVFDRPNGRHITFQVWDWADDARSYHVHQFLMQQQEDDTWRTQQFTTRYRALLRADLDAALQMARLEGIRWHGPESSGYYQPIVTARAH